MCNVLKKMSFEVQGFSFKVKNISLKTFHA